MKRYKITAIMTDECVCVGHSAADALALVLDHAETRWFLHWKQKPRATTRTWHLVITNLPPLIVSSYVPYSVDAEDANEAMVALGKMLIEDRPEGLLDWLGGQYFCRQIRPTGCAIPVEVPQPIVVPDTAVCLLGDQLTEDELEGIRKKGLTGPVIINRIPTGSGITNEQADQLRTTARKRTEVEINAFGRSDPLRDMRTIMAAETTIGPFDAEPLRGEGRAGDQPLTPEVLIPELNVAGRLVQGFGGFADETLSSLGGAGGQPINETDTGFVQARSTGHSVTDAGDGFNEPVLGEAQYTGYPGPWTVTVVMADRSWGGREEGGWWFDTFDPFDGHARERAIDEKIDRLFWNMAEAIAYSLKVDEKCKEWNTEERRRRKDSVASIGVYEAYVYEGYPVRIPAEKPMYE